MTCRARLSSRDIQFADVGDRPVCPKGTRGELSSRDTTILIK
jgi:hypothetical protein